jgi:hypothetical protein
LGVYWLRVFGVAALGEHDDQSKTWNWRVDAMIL